MNIGKLRISITGIAPAIFLAANLLFTSNLMAQDYPAKPIKVLVGYAPGGAVDMVARTLGQSLSASLGQSIVIENKPGAGSNIAVRQLIDSPADGYTLMVAANALAANESLYKPQPFDIDKDITPIAMIGRVPVVLAVSADSKYQKLSDLIKAAKANPDLITYGTPGNGGAPHMAMKLFEQSAGIPFQNAFLRSSSSSFNASSNKKTGVLCRTSLSSASSASRTPKQADLLCPSEP
jgi:tripartite-type tricarboxylate transporter receptor subunit TctC